MYYRRETGKVTLESGKIYLRGAVRKVEKEEFVVPLNTIVRIGVYYVESTITELEDENLRDPAVGTRNYQEVGAARLKVSTIWGHQAESVTVNSTNGEFYPIYNIENGILIEHSPPPQANIVTTALARYDKEANGSYVVNGLEVMFLQKEEEGKKQVFVINEGKAHVDGYEIELPHSIRISFDEI
ncbi:putative virulence protein VrlC.1 [Wolbachia endosymbiont of Armadillidium vulgare str. wVulC]|nr:putative virulence protein VrlC.1 [Wolbachia endosymbiont of Armadillidium vulgare str. wVulC]